MYLEPYLTPGFGLAALAGFVGAYIRGYTGFGTNLIWAPVLVSVVNPVEALAIMGMVGLVGTIQLTIPVMKYVDWKGIYPIVLASWLTVPFGIWVLYNTNAITVRRIIGIFILFIALILLTGWRYSGQRTGVKGFFARVATGGLAGVLAGFGGVGGSIPVLYFMASSDPAHILRANNIVAVAALIPMALGILIFSGAVTYMTIVHSIILFFPFTIGTWLGVHSFKVAPPEMFRKTILILLIVIGVSALGLE
jgi:uncharacterized membrane protein YfcA